MKTLTKTHKILSIAIFIATLSWAIAGFLYWKITAHVVVVDNLITEADKDIQKDQAQRAIRAIIQEHDDSLQELDTYFVSKESVVSFIDKLESLREKTGAAVSINSVANDSEKSKNNFSETLKIRVDATGSWIQILSFLNELEHLPYHVKIDSATVGLSSASDKLLFSSVSTTDLRQRSAEEYWKGSFELSLTQLK